MGNQNPIGVFDSGLGGLTVMREIMRQMPSENIVYFGDTARVPYGSKSKDTIVHFSRQIVSFLRTKNVKAIVVACNTASALALEEVQKYVDIPMIGVVKPGAYAATEVTRNGRIGVIATEATVSSGVYEKYIQAYNSEISVFQKACPLLVSLVEEGWWHDSVTTEVVARYVNDLKSESIDTLIMGCTHYPLLRSTFSEVLGQQVSLINPAYETAMELKKLLAEEKLSADQLQAGNYSFYVSDDPDRFQKFATSVLKFDVDRAEKIAIETYDYQLKD